MGQSQTLPVQDYSTVPHITSAAGKRLYIKSWIPEGDIRALCYFCHGVCEHIERYHDVAGVMNKLGVAAFGHDHVGHGRSEGDPVHVKDYAEYEADMSQRLKSVREEHPGLPLVLYGHSMGGLVAFLVAAKHTDLVDYVILSAPAAMGDPEVATPIKVAMARMSASVAPQLQLGNLPDELISRNQAVLEERAKDPYIWHGGMKAAWAVATLNAQDVAKTLFADFKTPLLLIHGTGDKICKIDGSREIVESISSEDKTMKTEGLASIRHSSAVAISPSEREKLTVTVKVFLNALEPSALQDAVSTALAELKITRIDTLLLSLPIDDDELFTKDVVYPVWQVAEELHAAQLVGSLGIADLDVNTLELLCSWAQVQPSINQVNLASCCVIPKELADFAEKKGIKLLTHPDPKKLLAPGAIQTCVRSPVQNGACFQPSWVTRYSTVITTRGVVQHKGYVALFNEPCRVSNGKSANGC